MTSSCSILNYVVFFLVHRFSAVRTSSVLVLSEGKWREMWWIICFSLFLHCVRIDYVWKVMVAVWFTSVSWRTEKKINLPSMHAIDTAHSMVNPNKWRMVFFSSLKTMEPNAVVIITLGHKIQILHFQCGFFIVSCNRKKKLTLKTDFHWAKQVTSFSTLTLIAELTIFFVFYSRHTTNGKKCLNKYFSRAKKMWIVL